MVLSDADIVHQLNNGELEVEGYESLDEQLQPASFDMRLGNEFREFTNGQVECITRDTDPEEYTEVVDANGEYVFHPGEFVLGTTIESVSMPNGLYAEVDGRSSIGRLGIVVHATAGIIDPGYEGQITLEMTNLGNAPVKLETGRRVAQITIEETKSKSDRPYGAERGSRYQGQSGPVASRIGRD